MKRGIEDAFFGNIPVELGLRLSSILDQNQVKVVSSYLRKCKGQGRFEKPCSNEEYLINFIRKDKDINRLLKLYVED